MSFRKAFDKIANKAGYVRNKPERKLFHMGFPTEKKVPSAIKGGQKYMYSAGYGLPRYEVATGGSYDPEEMLQLSMNHWASACINHLLNDVASTPWAIEPIDPKKYEKDHLEYISTWFFNPNQNRESFSTLMCKVARDILTLDAGVFVHTYAIAEPHGMVQLFARDGGRYFKEVKAGILGVKLSNVAWTQYDSATGLDVPATRKEMVVGYWEHDIGGQIPFEPAEVTYMMQHPLTHYDYGLSNMEVLKLAILTLNHGAQSLEKYFRDGEVRKALLVTDEPISSDEEWKRFLTRLETRIKESPHNIIPSDTKGTLMPLGLSRKDMQWSEESEEYRKAIFGMFHVTPAVLGITTAQRAAAKGTEDSQREVYMRKGLFPLLKLLEYHINMEIVTEFYRNDKDHKGKFAGKDPDVYFRFDIFDPIQARRDLEMDQLAFDLGIPLNRLLKARGIDPVPWGDLNPLVVKTIQQWTQSVWYNAISVEQFQRIANIPTLEEAKKILKAMGEPPKDLGVSSKSLFYNWKKRKFK